ncbi:MAG: serine/threonine protein kinase [Labilithrix sp.]|nr:serine/threonine protein kinase [Labilithrix sp.]
MLPSGQVERYEIIAELASGGMGTVYLARQHGAFGFRRTVAIKSMHPQLAKDDEFRSMFLDEAHLTAKIRHPNVVSMLDVVYASNKLLLVMEFVDGVALSTLLDRAIMAGERLPATVAVAIAIDALNGLHAAHELADEGRSLAVVHRDVSPANLLVGSDGLTRVLDFGIAKANDRRTQTRTGEVKGKLAYMSPEQLHGQEVDRRTDIYATGVVLWEALAGRRLFDAPNQGALSLKVTEGLVDPVSLYAAEEIPEALDGALLKALARDPAERFATAEEMALALAAALSAAPHTEVKKVVAGLARDLLDAPSRLSTPAEAKTIPDNSERAMLEEALTDKIETRAWKKASSPSSPSTPSTPSTPSSSSPPSPPSWRRLSPMTAAALGIAGTLFGVTGFMFLLRTGPAALPPTAAPSAEAPGVTAPPMPSAIVASPTVLVPSASASTSTPTPAARPSTNGKRPPQVPSSSTAKAPDCNPSFTVDDAGRHYKPECFQ